MRTLSSIRKIFGTANLSFQQDGHSAGSAPSVQASDQPFGQIFAPHGYTHDFIRRASAFALLTHGCEFILNVPVSAVQYAEDDAHTIIHKDRVYDCAILEANLSGDDMGGDIESKFLHIYRDQETGLYAVGNLIDGVLSIDNKIINTDIDVDAAHGPAHQLEDHQIYLEVFKWSRDLAEDYSRLRSPLMDTMDHKKSLPGQSLPARVGRAFVIELSNYIHRTFC